MPLLSPKEKIEQLIDQLNREDQHRKKRENTRQQLMLLALLNPNAFIMHLLIPIWQYREDIKTNRSPNTTLQGLNAWYPTLLNTPRIQQLVREAEDANILAQVWMDRTQLKPALDLEIERTMCQNILTKHKKISVKNQETLKLVTKRSALINTANGLNRQIIELCHYYQSWRIHSASSPVRFFKRMKIKHSRQCQLERLHAATLQQDDAARLKILKAISKEIQCENNLFKSEMGKRIQAIVSIS